MTYYNQSGNGRTNGQQGQRKGRPYESPQPSAPVEAKTVPENYVDEAERVIGALRIEGNGKIKITTTKIRSLFALATEIYNKENLRTEVELLPDSQLKLMRMRVRIVYDAGREPDVRNFVEKAHLLEYLKGIGSCRANMIRFTHYMEALVAYHRFMGGKEN